MGRAKSSVQTGMETEGERIDRTVIVIYSRPLLSDLKPAEKRLACLCDLSWISVECSVEHSQKNTRLASGVVIIMKKKTPTTGHFGLF